MKSFIIILTVTILTTCATLVYYLAADQSEGHNQKYQFVHGGIIRGDTSQKALALVFTGGDYGEGGNIIRQVLKNQQVKASFFFTGDFYRNNAFEEVIRGLKEDGHYLGAHSDKHLLYCAWENRDSLLVSKELFVRDLLDNYAEMERFGIPREEARYYIPPYEWYNDSISVWTAELGFILINYTPGTLSTADYTTPDMGARYRPSEVIYDSIIRYEQSQQQGLNGFILLLHIGTHPDRSDKFYERLDELIGYLKSQSYELLRVDDLL